MWVGQTADKYQSFECDDNLDGSKSNEIQIDFIRTPDLSGFRHFHKKQSLKRHSSIEENVNFKQSISDERNRSSRNSNRNCHRPSQQYIESVKYEFGGTKNNEDTAFSTISSISVRLPRYFASETEMIVKIYVYAIVERDVVQWWEFGEINYFSAIWRQFVLIWELATQPNTPRATCKKSTTSVKEKKRK